jgi:hypothetical protein
MHFVQRVFTNIKIPNDISVFDASYKTRPNGLTGDFMSLTYAAAEAILSRNQSPQLLMNKRTKS